MEAVAVKPQSTQFVTVGSRQSTLREVNAETAATWLETLRYDRQRSVRQWHVDYLADEMKRGNFIQGSLIHLAKLNGKLHLIDGQHRLWAVVASGLPQMFTVLETDVQSEDEIGWLYGNTDIGLKRTASDLYGALQLTEELGMLKRQINALSSATVFMKWGCLRQEQGSYRRVHRDDGVQLIRSYAPYAKQFFEIIAGCEQRIFVASERSATLSLALLTLKFAAPRAERRNDPSVLEFWRGVVFDDGVRVNDPRKIANRHLLSTAMIGSGATAKDRERVTPAYSVRYLANCFNAYMARRELKQKTKVYDHNAPLDAYGVPRDHNTWF